MLLLFLSILLVRIKATTLTLDLFTNPPASGKNKDYSGNPTYNINQALELSWNMSFARADVWIYQDSKPGEERALVRQAQLLENTSDESLNWIVSYEGMDPSINNVFYFRVSSSSEDYSTFTSHYFWIVGEEGSSSAPSVPVSTSMLSLSSSSSSSTTTRLSTTLPTSSSSSSYSSSTETAVSTQTTPSPSPDTSTNSTGNNGTSMGLIIAFSISGTGLVLAGGTVMVMKRAKRRARQSEKKTEILHESSLGSDTASSNRMPASRHGTQELEGYPRAEAEGDRTMWDHQPQFWRHEISAVSPTLRPSQPAYIH
ncbi:hypothetical protein M434DRAFT_32232 [Hypoxylon sp. CO27-5]|nr:hypothetical protein M434DRAFT_32232 [Hypoxylon sp. CO27-5]